MPTQRPNVVFLITDQQQGRTLDSNAPFETPNIDRIADDGTRFSNCQCVHPQCSPSRAALLTGQYPHQTGVLTLSGWGPYELDPATPNVGRSFRDAGYETTWIGRWDLGAENITDLGWEFTRNVDVTGSPGREGKNRDETTVTEAVQYIENYDRDRPFFLTAGFNLPHPSFFEDDQFSDENWPEKIDMPDNFDDDLEDKPQFHRDRAEDTDMTPDEIREMRYQYQTMVSRIDSYVGRITDALREAGHYDETILVVTSDHGDMQGGHGLVKKGTFAYDEVLRVPLVVRIPGLETNGSVVDSPVSGISVSTTLLDAAGLDVPETFEGESLVPYADSTVQEEDTPVFFEHKYALHGEHPFRGVRTADWKYVEYVTDDSSELYDLRDDPGEMINLAAQPEHADTKQRLKGLIQDWWTETGGENVDWTEPVSLPGRP